MSKFFLDPTLWDKTKSRAAVPATEPITAPLITSAQPSPPANTVVTSSEVVQEVIAPVPGETQTT